MRRITWPQDSSEAARLDRALLKSAYDADFDRAVAALEAGGDVNFVDPSTGLAALHIAVGTNQLDLARASLGLGRSHGPGRKAPLADGNSRTRQS